MSKLIWKILIIIGLLPFVGCLIYSIYNSVVGFTGLCFFQCENVIYGLDALGESIILYSYIFWPLYIIGLIFIVIAILKLRKKNYE